MPAPLKGEILRRAARSPPWEDLGDQHTQRQRDGSGKRNCPKRCHPSSSVTGPPQPVALEPARLTHSEARGVIASHTGGAAPQFCVTGLANFFR